MGKRKPSKASKPAVTAVAGPKAASPTVAATPTAAVVPPVAVIPLPPSTQAPAELQASQAAEASAVPKAKKSNTACRFILKARAFYSLKDTPKEPAKLVLNHSSTYKLDEFNFQEFNMRCIKRALKYYSTAKYKLVSSRAVYQVANNPKSESFSNTVKDADECKEFKRVVQECWSGIKAKTYDDSDIGSTDNDVVSDEEIEEDMPRPAAKKAKEKKKKKSSVDKQHTE